ncbi:MAG: hypothetical protein WKF78_12115 [Candidatus Limnocylindrales bacterium]
MREIALVLLLGVGDAPERAAEVDPDPLGIGAVVHARDESAHHQGRAVPRRGRTG